MDKFRFAFLLMLSASAVAAEDFDGKKPMSCAATQGHDCLPTQKACNELKPEAGKELNLNIDVTKKTVRTPYRYDTLPIESTKNNAKSLVIQGTNLEFAWTATIHRTNGRFTLAIADREGAYVIFGQCQIAAAKSAGS
jgi:hypothetical protein